MRIIVAVLALLACGTASAAKEPTPIGDGKYMLSDQNFTIFGSTDKIVAKLMKQATEFCTTKTGKGAVLLQSGGDEAQPGQFSNGQLQRGARGATGTIYFQCGAPEPDLASTTNKLDAIAKLKALLDSGALTQEEFDAQKKKLLGQ